MFSLRLFSILVLIFLDLASKLVYSYQKYGHFDGKKESIESFTISAWNLSSFMAYDITILMKMITMKCEAS